MKNFGGANPRVIGFAFVGAIIVGLFLAFAPGYFGLGSGDAAPRNATVSAADQHAERAKAQRFWNGVLTPLSMAGFLVQLAGASYGEGNRVDAQQYLEKAQDYLAKAKEANLADRPDGWDGISNELDSATFGFGSAIDKIRDGLDSGASRPLSDALDDARQAGGYLASATHDARVWYIAKGGKGEDLTDYARNVAALNKLTATFTGDSSSGNP